MTEILYYSNHCNNSKSLLQQISKMDQTMQKDMHFLSIDNRVKQANGATNIVLENGQQLLLPPLITKVPALLLLSKGNHVLFGNEIMNYLDEREKSNKKKQINEGEPTSYNNFGSMGGINSDMFSFIDQDTLAEGDGGMRLQHNYMAFDNFDSIETPPDTHTSEKANTGNSMEKLTQARNLDVNKK